jgi:putative transposase
MLTDLRNCDVKDVFFGVCDGLKGLSKAVGSVWAQAIVQSCIIHLVCNIFRLTSRKLVTRSLELASVGRAR